jgi:hypothetical protein
MFMRLTSSFGDLLVDGWVRMIDRLLVRDHPVADAHRAVSTSWIST